VKKKQSEIFKRFGLRRTAVLAPILQLPVWLLFVETIRRMCGTHEGLLGLVVKPFTSSIPTDTAVDAPIVESVAVPLEVSMGYEGALWFPDLLVPDPMLILPCVLSAALFANVSYNERRTIEGQGDLRSKFNIRITRILKTIALAALPLTLQLPSAMLVYWISSSVAALGQSFLFDRFLPYESIKPCKPEPRPFWMKLIFAQRLEILPYRGDQTLGIKIRQQTTWTVSVMLLGQPALLGELGGVPDPGYGLAVVIYIMGSV
jgi:inner membrane protein COX18